MGADASLKVPLISAPIPLAKAYFLYEAPGYVAATLTTKTSRDIYLGEIVLQK